MITTISKTTVTHLLIIRDMIKRDSGHTLKLANGNLVNDLFSMTAHSQYPALQLKAVDIYQRLLEDDPRPQARRHLRQQRHQAELAHADCIAA